MKEKFFDLWNELKKRLHEQPNVASRPGGERYFQVRDVWFCSIGANVGYEQDGKHENFERPVLIVQKFNHDVFWGVPLTSNLKEGFYYAPIFIGAHKNNSILSQMSLWDARRLLRKIGKISEQDYQRVIEQLICILKLNGSPQERGASEPEGVVKLL